MMKTTDSVPVNNIDEYLSALSEDVRNALEALRKTIKEAAPEAEEVISYQIPAFKYHGMLVYFAAYSNHCSFFVGNGSLIASMKEELKTYSTTKSAIHFTVEKPLPVALVQKIVWRRMGENEEKAAKKKPVSKKK